MRSKEKHIDDVQPATVDQHFRILVADEDTIDYDESEQVTPADLPEWYDAKLYKAGQDYYRSNSLGLTTAIICGLVAVLAVPSILKVLIYTKKSGTACAAFKRYLETSLHTRAWYMADLNVINSDWFKSTNTVRWKHCLANRRALRDGIGGITHRDMALTQYGMIGYVLLEPESLGLTNTKDQREGINHVLRVVGHMLGISDRLNICRKNEAETTALCRRLQAEVFGKYFEEVPPNFVDMVTALLDGMWSIDMSIDTGSIFAFSYKLNRVPYTKPLSTYSWLVLKYREASHKLCGTPGIGVFVRAYYNFLINFNFLLIKKWPVIAWLQYGFEQSKIYLYPQLQK
ncbi:uncharacterized protein LOC124298156 [Neodiprion virginianus]|uniref:uncharacterized protein LOC124298156 n=1 Tax=Neodiprion virginianus TaxID=2961670 RepID=UPI001EE6F642|nr:uncharacterized protein LOC124298156 [Neodiprion virginianus]